MVFNWLTLIVRDFWDPATSASTPARQETAAQH